MAFKYMAEYRIWGLVFMVLILIIIMALDSLGE